MKNGKPSTGQRQREFTVQCENLEPDGQTQLHGTPRSKQPFQAGAEGRTGKTGLRHTSQTQFAECVGKLAHNGKKATHMKTVITITQIT